MEHRLVELANGVLTLMVTYPFVLMGASRGPYGRFLGGMVTAVTHGLRSELLRFPGSWPTPAPP